jgi:hypothetical protein
MSKNSQSPKITVLVAAFTVVGTLGTALLTNWDKVFPNRIPVEPDVVEPVGADDEKSQTELLEVKFNVYAQDYQPIELVEVQFIFDGAPSPKYTDSNGYVSIEIPKRKDIEVILRKNGFRAKRQILNLEADRNRTVTIYLDRISADKDSGDTSVTSQATSQEIGENAEPNNGVIASENSFTQPTIRRGYCTFLAANQGEDIVNNSCLIHDYDNGAYKLMWSNGKVSHIMLNPSVSIDNTSASIVESGDSNMTIQSIDGKVGFCWNCSPP